MTTGTAQFDLNGIEEIVEAIMTEGYVLQDFTTITQEETEALYATAYNLINQAQYAKAEKCFEMLCQLDHYQGRFWMGLGACRQMLKNYETAVAAYANAGIHDMENPMPGLRAAECYLVLNKLEEAKSGASAAVHWAGDKPEHRAVKNRAEMILETIKNRQGEAS